MEEKFIQKRMGLDSEKSNGKLKIENLCKLINNHPYKEEIYNEFDLDNISQEYILLEI